MDVQFILNDKGERTAAIVPINDYEDFLHQSHLKLELTKKYQRMIDTMLKRDPEETNQCLSLDDIKTRFSR